MCLIERDGQSWGKPSGAETDVQGSEKTLPLEEPVAGCRRSLDNKVKAKCLLHG